MTGASAGELEAGFDYMKAMIEAGATLDIWEPDEFTMTAESGLYILQKPELIFQFRLCKRYSIVGGLGEEPKEMT